MEKETYEGAHKHQKARRYTIVVLGVPGDDGLEVRRGIDFLKDGRHDRMLPVFFELIIKRINGINKSYETRNEVYASEIKKVLTILWRVLSDLFLNALTAPLYL